MKSWIQSKTIWFAIAQVLIAVAHCVEAGDLTREGIALAIIGAVTAALRKSTKTSIGKKSI